MSPSRGDAGGAAEAGASEPATPAADAAVVDDLIARYAKGEPAGKTRSTRPPRPGASGTAVPEATPPAPRRFLRARRGSAAPPAAPSAPVAAKPPAPAAAEPAFSRAAGRHRRRHGPAQSRPEPGRSGSRRKDAEPPAHAAGRYAGGAQAARSSQHRCRPSASRWIRSSSQRSCTRRRFCATRTRARSRPRPSFGKIAAGSPS